MAISTVLLSHAHRFGRRRVKFRTHRSLFSSRVLFSSGISSSNSLKNLFISITESPKADLDPLSQNPPDRRPPPWELAGNSSGGSGRFNALKSHDEVSGEGTKKE
ncbi:unnamed protein product [Citrullus colocynthis]|uniref:Uncharacterized protein n=1 Tax=Citrullus colocynthis TaxID=252529 RepID=A0ABP0XWF6_9ROSI